MARLKMYQKSQKPNAGEENTLKHLKSRLMSAMSMLLVAALLLSTVSYAWLTMSVAPEVTGVTTNIGSNGSLEIALLTTETRQDLSKIKTTFGNSLAMDNPSANNTWGNILDLSYSSYGLNNIALLPARLNIQQANNKFSVDSGLLSVPTYGFDGRIVSLSNDTVSAIYGEKGFATVLGQQDYGVRAIGTVDGLTVQSSALALAKSNITTYTNGALSAVKSTLSTNGSALFSMIIKKMNDSATYGEDDVKTIKSMISGLQSASNYIDLALRQGMLAVAASEIADEKEFELARTMILDQSRELSDIIEDVKDYVKIPDTFNDWVEKSASIKNNLNLATTKCDELSGESISWDEIKGALSTLIDTDSAYVNGKKINEWTKENYGSLLGGEIVVTLPPKSGVFADIADFAGNYEVNTDSATIKTASTESPAYLKALATMVNGLDAASGGSNAQVVLTAMYGYALDMAFRCNADLSDLLLQTSPEQRVYEDSTAASTLGGGSYMEFTRNGDELMDILRLIDAVRVAFIDDQGEVLGIAKPNTSNREFTETSVKAALYLYDFTIDEDGALNMGERKLTDNVITALEKNTAKAVTVVVWLDGDIVDNTVVSANETALSGKLNLQFSSSADLVPAENEALKNLAVTKTELQETMEAEERFYKLGQGTYTTASWSAYAKAYSNAQTLLDSSDATQSQIYQASRELAVAKSGLKVVSKSTLADEINEIRELMGETTDPARYVVKIDGKYVGVDPYTLTQQSKKIADIYRVDYENNLRDEGNDLKTPIYTDESWQNLAAALYEAEVVNLDPKATDEQINTAITNLANAQKSLQFAAIFIPYDYNDTLYYFAVSDVKDTYGKWYDSNFKRIVADVKILELDAYAEPADIAYLDGNGYISDELKYYVPSAKLYDTYYPSLKNDEIIGIKWLLPDAFVEGANQAKIEKLRSLIEQAGEYSWSGKDNDINAAEAAIEAYDELEKLEKKNDGKVESEYLKQIENVLKDVDGAISKLTIGLRQAMDKKAEDDAQKHLTYEQRSMLTVGIKRGNDALAALNDEIAELKAKKAELESAADETSKIAEQIKDKEDQKKALEEAIKAAQEILDKDNEGTISQDEATEKLKTLNEELKKAGQTEVTVEEDVLYSIPVGSEMYELVYEYYLPKLWLTEERGEAELKAVILTQNGVVYTLNETVTIYSKAAGVKISEDSVKLAVDGQIELSAELFAREIDEGDVSKFLPVEEEIKEYRWSSEDRNVVAVSDMYSADCQIVARAIGTTKINLTVVTKQGNTYTCSITVVVE